MFNGLTCSKGHLYTEEDTWTDKHGDPICKICVTKAYIKHHPELSLNEARIIVEREYIGKRRKHSVNQDNYLHSRVKSYGITMFEYNTIIEKQGFKCAICGIHENDLKNILFIDHCHVTGKVRGLLCQNCNTGLGMFKDNKEFLAKAIAYLAQ